MKRVVLYISDKCAHCREAKKYLDDQGIQYRLTNVKMPRARKELDALGACSVPVVKIGNEVIIGWNLKNFNKLYCENSFL